MIATRLFIALDATQSRRRPDRIVRSNGTVSRVTARLLCGFLLLAAVGGTGAQAETAAGPSAATRPTVAGTLQQGRKLTATPGTWAGKGTIGYAYQWYRCDLHGAHCGSIHGATRATYTEVARDVGRTLGLTVRATDRTGAVAAYSGLAGPMAAAASKLVASAQPPLSGNPIVGQSLATGAAGWSTKPSTVSTGWLRCNANARLCSAIPTATSATYRLTASDVGHTLAAVVTAAVGKTRQTVLSVSSGVVRTSPGPVAAARPSIGGRLQAGQKLTGSAGTWSGIGTIAYGYQWYRCDRLGAHCRSIGGATASTYTQVAADAGKSIGLTVRATDATGTTAAYSALAGIVANAAATLAVFAQASLSGTPAVGQVLKVTGGTFTITPASAGYTWLRCNGNGRLCTAIAAATTDTYTVTAADAGHALVAVVTVASARASLVALTTAASVPS
jgi:hypothetical protein